MATRPAASQTTRTATADAQMARRARLGEIARTYGLLLVIVAVALIFNVLTDGLFLSDQNVPLLLRQTAVTGIVALGVGLVILMGHIDLSIGSAVGLCAIAVAYLMDIAGWSVLAAVGATLILGIAIGLWQGFAVGYMLVPAFVVTLGGLLIWRGTGLVITEGSTIASFPQEFLVIGQGTVGPTLALLLAVVAAGGYLAWTVVELRRGLPFSLRRVASVAAIVLGGAAVVVLSQRADGLPVPVAMMLAIAVLLTFVTTRTRFGRRLYAIGGNREAARLAGINVRRTTLVTFTGMGVLYAVAGMVLAARLNGAPPGGAPFLELDAIAAAVIGGTSLMGGVGTVPGTLLGALLMGSVSNGLSLMNVPTFYQLIVSGLILIFAVFFDVQTKRRGLFA